MPNLLKRPLRLLLALLPATALAQAPAAIPYTAHPDVPATMQVAGLRLELDEDARRLVQQKADALCRHQPSFLARVNLADASFPLIDAVLQREGVPLDFRYLALQESALQGNAESPHGAVGYWQFKQETALELGLVINEAVDERRHLTASTRAAARYMLRSNASLQNWLNALLSYYTGLGGVKPYVLPTDAGASTLTLTAATNPYVLMFLAQKIAFEPAIGANPHPPLRLREFPALPGQTLAQQAQTIYADPAALAVHNRWLLAPAVPADGRAYTLVVPVADAAQTAGVLAQQNIQTEKDLLKAPARDARNPAEVRLNGLRAIIALPGETLADLAGRGHQHLGTFLRHNELTGFDAVVPGRAYFLENKRETAAIEYHVVAPDETLPDVAQRYGIRQRAILAKNRLSHPHDLRPGRVLWLQHTRPREVAEEYRSLPEGRALEGANAVTANAPAPAAPRPARADSLPTAPAVAGPTTATAAGPTPPLGPDGWPVAPPTTAGRPMPTAPPSAPPRPAVVTRDESLEELNRMPAAPAPTPPARAVPKPRTEAAVALPPRPAATPAPPAPKPQRIAEPQRDVPVPTAPTPAADPPATRPAFYTVQARETVYALARRFDLMPANLLEWNALAPNASLRLGQVLRLTPAPARRPTATGGTNSAALYVPKTPPVATPTGAASLPKPAATHTVAVGETCYAIAKRYRLTLAQLLEINHKTAPEIHVGEVLQVSEPPQGR